MNKLYFLRCSTRLRSLSFGSSFFHSLFSSLNQPQDSNFIIINMNIDESDPHHGEVWDDSLLIDSWNQALKEYKVRP